MQQIQNAELNFDDIFDVLVPEWWESPWNCALLGIAMISCAGLIFLLVRWYTAYKKKQQQTPRMVALKRISLVIKAVREDPVCLGNEAGAVQAREWYVELFSLIKQYLSDEYGLPVVSKTDSELYAYLKAYESNNSGVKIPDNTEWLGVINTLLEHGISVKFGQAAASCADVLKECEIIRILLIRSSQRKERA